MFRQVIKGIVMLIAVFAVLATLLIIFIAVFRHNYIYTSSKNSPFSQKNTHWVSNCGRVSFTVNNDNSADGTITLLDETIVKTVIYDFPPEHKIFVYDYADSYIDDTLEYVGDTTADLRFTKHIEIWKHRYYKNRFVAIVKESTYFEEGERLVFRRVDDQ